MLQTEQIGISDVSFWFLSDDDDDAVTRTSWQVAHREAVLDAVAGLSITPTLQAGVLLLRRLQHVVTAQTLKTEKERKYSEMMRFVVNLICLSFFFRVFYWIILASCDKLKDA